MGKKAERSRMATERFTRMNMMRTMIKVHLLGEGDRLPFF